MRWGDATSPVVQSTQLDLALQSHLTHEDAAWFYQTPAPAARRYERRKATGLPGEFRTAPRCSGGSRLLQDLGHAGLSDPPARIRPRGGWDPGWRGCSRPPAARANSRRQRV